MQLSNREKLLVLILSIVAIISGFYYFVEKPELEKIADLKKEKTDYAAKVLQLKTQISVNNPVYEQSRVLEEKVRERTTKFYPFITQEKIIEILEKKFTESKFQPLSVTFDTKPLSDEQKKDPVDEFLNSGTDIKLDDKGGDLLNQMAKAFLDYKPVVKTVNDTEAKDKKVFESAIKSISRLGASITFEGTYENLSLFIKSLETEKRRIVIDSIECTKDIGSERITGKINLSFYAIPKLFVQDEDYFIWNHTNKYGKYNPFLVNGKSMNLGPSTTKPATADTSEDTADFFISLKPTTSDVHSVMIGKKGTDGSGTSISADNPYNENVEIEFVQKDSKYYYRYKTSKGSYPKDYSQLVEFLPLSGKIVIEITSSKRVNAEDLSGANIRILNNTDLKVYANVLFDDKEDHRAKFVKKTGSVIVSSAMEE